MRCVNIFVLGEGKVTKLTNLESLDIFTAGNIAWQEIKKLTKLLAFTDNVENISDEDFAELNQITQLTSLDLSSAGTSKMSAEKISNLTNLRRLDLDVLFDESPQNFALFGNLTTLVLHSAESNNGQIRLPQGLKVFERPIALSSALWNEVIGVDSIESLAFEWQSDHPTYSQLTAEDVTRISRLTNMKDLDFASSLPQGNNYSIWLEHFLRLSLLLAKTKSNTDRFVFRCGHRNQFTSATNATQFNRERIQGVRRRGTERIDSARSFSRFFRRSAN